MTIWDLLGEAEQESRAQCLGCCNEFVIDLLMPVNEVDWLCRPCYRNELEGLV